PGIGSKEDLSVAAGRRSGPRRRLDYVVITNYTFCVRPLQSKIPPLQDTAVPSMQSTAYNRVAAALRDQILAGSWDGRNQLPTERELCEQFQTSRITIRRALQILEDEQLVERH